MVMDQGNFHIVDNYLKFTYSWQLTDLSKSAESHLNLSVDFISSRSFKNHINYERSQNFRFIAILHVFLVFIQTKCPPFS